MHGKYKANYPTSKSMPEPATEVGVAEVPLTPSVPDTFHTSSTIGYLRYVYHTSISMDQCHIHRICAIGL